MVSSPARLNVSSITKELQDSPVSSSETLLIVLSCDAVCEKAKMPWKQAPAAARPQSQHVAKLLQFMQDQVCSRPGTTGLVFDGLSRSYRCCVEQKLPMSFESGNIYKNKRGHAVEHAYLLSSLKERGACVQHLVLCKKKQRSHAAGLPLLDDDAKAGVMAWPKTPKMMAPDRWRAPGVRVQKLRVLAGGAERSSCDSSH